MAKLEQLNSRREALLNELNQTQDYVSNFDVRNSSVNTLKARITVLNDIKAEFREIQAEIERADKSTGFAEQSTIRARFTDQYCDTLAAINDAVETATNATPVPNPASRSPNFASTHLPILSLKTFDGNYKEWLSFENSFKTIIHENKALNDCQRLQYLKTTLRSDALSAIENLPLQDENYARAMEILEARFKNIRLIVNDHVQTMLEIPALHKTSHVALRGILNTVTTSLIALKTLNLPVEHWDALLVPIVAKKLDYGTKREWQMELGNNLPSYEQLRAFLEKRCSVLAALDCSSNKTPSDAKFPANAERHRTAVHAATTKGAIECPFCKSAEHTISQCGAFQQLDTKERSNLVKRLKLCSNCLRKNHQVMACKSTSTCRSCRGKHHTLLHNGANVVKSENVEDKETVTNHATMSENRVLLSTAVVLIKTAKNQYIECRAFLDSGSMSNYITSSLQKRLGLKASAANIQIKGLNGTASASNLQTVVDIKSKHNSFATRLNCLVIQNITENLPITPINPTNLEIPNVHLADPKFYNSRPVDLLIGAGLFWKLLNVGQINTPGGLTFQKTHLGFIAGGVFRGPKGPPQVKSCCNLALNQQETRLEAQLKNFWELENVSSNENSKCSREELDCEQHFVKTMTRDPEGRFIVKLPFKTRDMQIGKTKEAAYKRFQAIERKLTKQPQTREQYSLFMSDYLNLNHMEEANRIERCNDAIFLPHHAVYKEDGSSAKIRVVFDASMKGSNGESLNDNLMMGPVIQESLFSILLGFRKFKFALNADIVKMYRQIRMHPDHTKFQLIFWRDRASEELKTYKLTTLTYGTKPASFIATRCLKVLADENQSQYPKACDIIRRNFYMDDMLTGADSVSDVLKIKQNVTNILSQGGFILSKFSSNADIDQNFAPTEISLSKEETNKVLGLHWNPQNDILKFSIKVEEIPTRITKRTILSTSAKIFDPLGLVGPITMTAKITLQQLWSLGVGWDESLPQQIHTGWQAFVRQFKNLNNLSIPRSAIANHESDIRELHGFCDASTHGYGAVFYVRTKTIDGKYASRLLCSKSRVAPLATTTIPRLELCGALLLARLLKHVKKSFGLLFNRTILWTDSSIVLAWISAPSNTLKTFAANRVAEIQLLTTPSMWRHVRSEHNAADTLSRGANPDELLKNSAWFSGPSFLMQREEQWPASLNFQQLDVPEKRTITTGLATNAIEMPIFHKFSSFHKLQRVFGWILRFTHNTRKENPRKHGNLRSDELKAATLVIVRIIQKLEFASDLKLLSERKAVNSNSRILPLSPFLDNTGIIRVGGRLKNSALANDVKHPIILPNNHVVTTLLIKGEHERELHAGAQATLASLRRRFWVLSARNTIRNVIHKCHKCFRANPSTAQPKMGDLPSHRSRIARPFEITGVDYAGPVLLRESRGRGKRLMKAYIAIFVCFTVKAVHIELVTDLTTAEFLGALRRFVGRRGAPSDIYSDNGTNFVGANNELNKFIRQKQNQNDIESDMIKLGVRWHFIPPKSPHMGGLWEINVKSIKQHLKKTIADAHLTFSEMYTLLVRIEACLNSRPLTPISSDPNDLDVLTPGHFLVGEPLTALPESDAQSGPINRLSRWQLTERIRDHFWKRWTREYLTQLQNRPKWTNHTAGGIEVGTMVLIKEDNMPPLLWKLGRVLEVHPGKDEIIRVATVRTSQGQFKRSVRKLCPLPISYEQ